MFYVTASTVAGLLVYGAGLFGIQNLVAVEIGSWPTWLQLLMFICQEILFCWNISLLHKSTTL